MLLAIMVWLTRAVLAKYKPLVIAVTGSVGKTSTKDAIFGVLARRFRVRRSGKSYNSEFGVPLTVIGALSPGRNPFGWLGVLWRGAALVLFKQTYPDVLVLEFGVQKPGDMQFLLGMIQPTVGVLTAISPAHIEYFSDVGAYAAEKRGLIQALPKNGCAVISQDNPEARAAVEMAPCPVVTFGLSEGAMLRGSALEPRLERPRGSDGVTVAGVTLKVSRDGQMVPLVLRESIAAPAVSSALAAIAVGMHMGMNMLECVEGLDTFVPPPGRMRVVPGIKYTTLIDDTYNSSPLAAKEAVETLRTIDIDADDRRIAVMGDMLELGMVSEQQHREVGEKIAAAKIDMLVTVGERARDMARGAIDRGFPKERCIHFATAPEAGKYLQGILKIGDVLLVKGSQGMRMEKIVKELMAEPLRAPFVLVRQEPPWV